MKRDQLIKEILKKRSFLCIGLDTDPKNIPPCLLSAKDPVFEFNKHIIEATKDLCVAYKINTAFYENYGVKGWDSLQATWNYLPKNCLSIADAKRSDIGNTSERYAKAFFEPSSSGLGFHAITINPYMGYDSVSPFLNVDNKWAIVLALTSNKGSEDFQFLMSEGMYLFEHILQKAITWAGPERMMFVVGATHAKAFTLVRKHAPMHFLLVPGLGQQQGNLAQVCHYGMNQDVGLLVNASRSIIYASNGIDFAEQARNQAYIIQKSMTAELDARGF